MSLLSAQTLKRSPFSAALVWKSASLLVLGSPVVYICPWCLAHHMGVYLTDKYTPLPTTTFCFLYKLYLTDFKSKVNSIQDSVWNVVLSLLDLGAFLGCVHEHVNSVEAEMNSCDFYWNICLLMRKWSSQMTSLFSTCDWLCHLNLVFVSLEFVHLSLTGLCVTLNVAIYNFVSKTIDEVVWNILLYEEWINVCITHSTFLVWFF